MRLLQRYVWIAALFWGMPALDAASAGASDGCRPKAVEILRSSSRDGFAIYRQVSQPDFFMSWIDCTDSQFDLSTAVHESTHFVTAEIDAFPLVGGGAIGRPHEVSEFFLPGRIASRFRHDDFAAIYLRQGKASSSTDFLYLLDELNAYSHDLETAVDLKDLSSKDEAIDHRDGLAALMAFVAVYAETAKASEPATWTGLRQPRVVRTLSALWGRAERVMASSCGIPNFGSKDKDYIRTSCGPAAAAAMGEIIGRATICPAACLAPDIAQDADRADGEVEPSAYRIAPEAFEKREGHDEDGEANLDRPHHPFNIKLGPSRRRLRSDDG